jgi:hypothetical protein
MHPQQLRLQFHEKNHFLFCFEISRDLVSDPPATDDEQRSTVALGTKTQATLSHSLRTFSLDGIQHGTLSNTTGSVSCAFTVKLRYNVLLGHKQHVKVISDDRNNKTKTKR